MARTFTTTTTGQTALQLPTGVARVTVDPTARTARIKLYTRDTEGPAVDAIHQATVNATHGLHVVVPDAGGSITVVSSGHGGRVSSVSVIGSNSAVITVGGSITVNGQRVSGSTVASHGIVADVTVPPRRRAVLPIHLR